MPSPSRLIGLLLFLLSLAAAEVRAQCSMHWLPGPPLPGTDGWVTAATMWDPDGGGGAPARLVVGGPFTVARDLLASGIAAWDPVTLTWSNFGAGMGGVPSPAVFALASLSNGDLVAGGEFTTAGGIAANNIARWNGTAWVPLGSGLNGVVRALTTLRNGDLIAGGGFTVAGGVPANGIARWDGSAWTPMGSGISANGWVFALATLPNRDLVIGGTFSMVGGVAARSLARWDGTSWAPLGPGVNGTVHVLTTLPSGDLVAGGTFTSAGQGVGVACIARWDGTAWAPFGAGIRGLSPRVRALTTLPNGDLVVGGEFSSAGSLAVNRLARWDGTTWSAVGNGVNGEVTALATLPSGDFVVGGGLWTEGAAPAHYVARWNGVSFGPLGPDLRALRPTANIFALTTLANGDVVAGGFFTAHDSSGTDYLARWDGAGWSALGGGFDSLVAALARLQNGDIVAGGSFTTAGGVAASGVAWWDGRAWWPLWSGVSGFPRPVVLALAVLPNGDLVAGGDFAYAGGNLSPHLARWNGFGWNSLGSGAGSTVRALTVLPNGDLIAGGDFTTIGGVAAQRIARWNGVAWSPLGAGIDYSVWALTGLANGDLVAGGAFRNAGGLPANAIERWNGWTWSSLGSGMDGTVRALTTMPNGDVLAAGEFTTAGGAAANCIARWDGASWSAVAGGLGGGQYRAQALALAWRQDGTLVAGGSFRSAGGVVSPYLAHLEATCPAMVAARASGCVGRSPVFVADSLPWVGSTFRSTCHGIVAGAIGSWVLGTASPATPLSTLHAAGATGCRLLASLDVTLPLLSVGGAARLSFDIPPNPALVGVVVHGQAIEVTATAGVITSITSSNSLTLTVGAF